MQNKYVALGSQQPIGNTVSLLPQTVHLLFCWELWCRGLTMTQEPRSEQALPHTVLTYLPYYLKVSLGIPMCVQREISSSDDQSRELMTQGTWTSLQRKGVKRGHLLVLPATRAASVHTLITLLQSEGELIQKNGPIWHPRRAENAATSQSCSDAFE